MFSALLVVYIINYQVLLFILFYHNTNTVLSFILLIIRSNVYLFLKYNGVFEQASKYTLARMKEYFK